MTLRALPVVAVATLLVGCVTTSGTPPAATLTETINTQVAREEGIPWSARRPLTWADFKGSPPANPGQVAAETAYIIIHGVRCSGSRFDFRVVAAFRPNDSWVLHDALRTPGDSAQALRHEQTHFDLSEVHARRLRRYFFEHLAPCNVSTNELEGRANQIERDERAAQERYDRETDHGRSETQQASWDKEVAGQLVALARFAG